MYFFGVQYPAFLLFNHFKMLCRIFLLAFGLQVALATPGLSPASNFKSRQSNTITVNLDQTYQKMDGFGFSQAFGTAYTIMNLPTTQQKQALDFLFNKTTGAGLTILRNGINVDVIEPANPGSPSTAPTYAWDGSDGAQVWVSQQAQTYGVSRFYADSWSAPAFMKTNDDESNGGYLCGVTGETCSSGDWKQAYANLIVQYIKDYQSAGVQITQVGFLNEPDFKHVAATPACVSELIVIVVRPIHLCYQMAPRQPISSRSSILACRPLVWMLVSRVAMPRAGIRKRQ